MFCLFSFIFILIIVNQLESDLINNIQFMFYSIYGLLMFYYTSKPYWTKNIEKDKKKRTNSDHQSKN